MNITHCFFCHNLLPLPLELSVDFVQCKNEQCAKNTIIYLVSFDGQLREFSFQAYYQGNIYLIDYTNNPAQVSIYKNLSLYPRIGAISLSSEFELLLTPHNFEKRFSSLLTYF